MPSLRVRSASIQSESLLNYLKKLPVVLPKTMWMKSKNILVKLKNINSIIVTTNSSKILGMHSFPWTLNIVNFQCYTIERKSQKNFIKNVSFNATIDLTSKIVSEPDEKEFSSINLCVYIDMSPIVISISEKQVKLIIKEKNCKT